jgi:hypothetical protein
MSFHRFLHRLISCCCIPCSWTRNDSNIERDQDNEETASALHTHGTGAHTQDHSPDSSELQPTQISTEVTIDIRAAVLPTAERKTISSELIPLHSTDPQLSAAQILRARELCEWNSLSLGWRVMVDPALESKRAAGQVIKRTHFYFNVWTGRTVWEAPRGVQRTLENQMFDAHIPGVEKYCTPIQTLRKWMHTDMKLNLVLWPHAAQSSSQQRQNMQVLRPLLCGFDIRGRAPSLWHLLFYAHVIRRELGLYPPDFLHAYGLRTILLADGLSLGIQSRMAIPLLRSGVLILDPRLEEISYVANVMHHELFHIIDVGLIWRAGEAERIRERDKSATVMPVGTKMVFLDDEEDWSSPRPFDFTTPCPQSLRGPDPLPPFAIEAAARLHSVPDYGWNALNNPPSFRYGSGGEKARGKEQWLSASTNTDALSPGGVGTSATVPSTSGMLGFLNAYSQSAVEEDKAEIFASVMRHSPITSIDDTTHIVDSILRAKGAEIRRRLEWGSSAIDETFWMRVREHTPHPERAALALTSSATNAAANPQFGFNSLINNERAQDSSNSVLNHSSHQPSIGQWEEKRTHEGLLYYFHSTTKQTSWLKPTHMRS